MRELLVVSLALGIGVAYAGDKKKAEKKPAPAAQKDPMAEAMAKAEKMATPGESHKALKALAGKFTVETTMWMEPGKPPMKAKGTEEGKLVLGDRFVANDFTGEMMGKPFLGRGLIGYDNAHKKYQMNWIDSMGTQMVTLDGTADATGKVITFTGDIYDPAFENTSKQRWVMKIESDARHAMEFYQTLPDGKEAKMMEIQYTRAP